MLLWIVVILVAVVAVFLLRPLFTKRGRARILRSPRLEKVVDAIVEGLITLFLNILLGIVGALLGGSNDDKRSSKSNRQGAFDGGGASGNW
jgi:uncharacterized membrane protein YgcG